LSNPQKRRLTLQIYGKTTYKVALHKVAGAIFPPTATEAWEKAGGKINFFNTKTHKTMRLRNKILAMAVMAVAGFNTYLANDIRVQRNELSLLNLENIADAQEQNPIERGDNIEGLGYATVTWIKVPFTNEWIYNSAGRKVMACGVKVYREVDCIGNVQSDCKPSYGFSHYVIY